MLVVVVLHSFLFFICCCFSFIAIFTFPSYFAMPPALHPGFSGPWRPPPALGSNPGYFQLLLLLYHRERHSFERAFCIHRRFLPYVLSPIFLIQPAFIKDSLGVGNSSLKFAGLHADDLRNTDLAHLFAWSTTIHNLNNQKNSFLNRAKYYSELLVVKSLI